MFKPDNHEKTDFNYAKDSRVISVFEYLPGRAAG